MLPKKLLTVLAAASTAVVLTVSPVSATTPETASATVASDSTFRPTTTDPDVKFTPQDVGNGAVTVSAISLDDSVLSKQITDILDGSSYVPMTFTYAPAAGITITAIHVHLIYAGVDRGDVEVNPNALTSGKRFFTFPSTWGPGTAQVTNVSFNYTDATGAAQAVSFPWVSNTVNVRMTASAHFRIKRIGTSVTFAVRGSIYNGTTTAPAAGKVFVIQRNVHGKWRTFRKVRLNKKGRSVFRTTIPQSRRYYYRLALKQTDILLGGAGPKLSRRI